MQNPIKHQQISNELLTEILAGKHDDSLRLPSETQLVKRFNVSRPTVARALLDLKSKGIIERRAGSGTYLCKDRAPSPAIRQLGLIVPGLGKVEIFDVICGELASLARMNDLGMHWGASTHPHVEARMSVEEAEEICTHYIAMGVSGVFFAPFEHLNANEAINRSITERLSHAGIPVILVDRDICAFPQRSHFDLVGIDNYAGGYLLAEHLIKLGARHLNFLARPFSASTVELRKAGAMAAMLAHGLTIPNDFNAPGDPSDLTYVRTLLTGKYDAVICCNDQTAAKLMQTLARMEIKTPQQVRVVGFDDVRFATLFAVPLTTIQQPCREIALTAFNAMRERLASPALPARSLLLNPRLVVRESCGAYLAK